MGHPALSKHWDSLNADERNMKIHEWRKEKKRNREQERRRNASQDHPHDWTAIPRTIEEVLSASTLISEKEIFKTRQYLELGIAEVCNILGKKPRYCKFDGDQSGEVGRKNNLFLCARAHSESDEFMIKAKKSGNEWVVTDVRGLKKSFRSDINESHNRKCSFSGSQLAPIILNLNDACLTLSQTTMRQILKTYVCEETISNGIIREVKMISIEKVFGSRIENTQFLFSLETEMESKGYIVNIDTCGRERMEEILLEGVQQQHSLEQRKKPKNERRKFDMNQWKLENADFLLKSLGDDKTDFFLSFIFTTKNAQLFSQHALKIMCADASHVKWGSCTLYSVYGVSSNYNAVCLCHAIIVGNENETGWNIVFNFLIKNFPGINNGCYTIITDRDKGLSSAMKNPEFKIRSFYCTFHRAENIKKRFGCRAVALFWKMVRCRSTALLNMVKKEVIDKLSENAASYLLNELDETQFPISCVENGGSLYGHTTSGLVESMNNANMSARVKHMDIFNSILELVKLENDRYSNFQKESHIREHSLTEFARKKYLSLQNEFNNYHIKCTGTHSSKIGIEQKFVVTEKSNLEHSYVTLSFTNQTSCYNYSCTCGDIEYNNFPCVHSVLCADRLGVLESKMVPFWFTTSNWRLQFPSNTESNLIDLSKVKSEGMKHDIKEPILVQRKAGRPAEKRIKKASFKRKHLYLCSSCRKPGHTYASCPENPKNNR